MALSSSGRGRMLAVATLAGLGLWLEGLIGMLLLVAATDLVMFRQPFSARPICCPALGVIGTGLLLVDPTLAFACGWLVELACDPALVTSRTQHQRALNH